MKTKKVLIINQCSGNKGDRSVLYNLLNLFDKHDNIIRADVFLKKENTSTPDTGLICNIKLSIPGPVLFAESSNGSFEASIASSVDELERQLQKRKDKMSRVK